MKKIAIYGLLALMSGTFVACDNYEEPNPPAQSNAQESILKTEDVVVASALAQETYELAKYNAEAKNIEIAQVTSDAVPAAYELGAEVQISKAGENKWNNVEATVERDAENPSIFHVFVAPDALQGVYVENISKSPVARNLDVRVKLTTQITVNKVPQVAYVGGKDFSYTIGQMSVLPIPNDVVLADDYYLIGDFNNWDVAKAVKMNHSGENSYDNPVFSVSVEITAAQATDGWGWKVISAEAYAAGKVLTSQFAQWGPVEANDPSLEGKLTFNKEGEAANQGDVMIQGTYLLSVNLMENSYNFSETVAGFWTPGDSNGWNFDNAQILSTTNYTDYYGFVNVQNQFKFTSEPSWDAKYNLGAADTEGEVANGSNNNIKVTDNGLYWVKLDLPGLAYTLYKVNALGLIGTATPQGWDASTNLTPSENNLVWTGTVKMGAGQYKIRANDAWDLSLGGDPMNLNWDNGANMDSPGEGTFDVKIDLSQSPYTITFTKKNDKRRR